MGVQPSGCPPLLARLGGILIYKCILVSIGFVTQITSVSENRVIDIHSERSKRWVGYGFLRTIYVSSEEVTAVYPQSTTHSIPLLSFGA